MSAILKDQAEPLEVSFDMAEAFLLALDEEAEAFTFQTFDDNKARKDKRLARVFHGSLDQHRDALAALNQRGAGVFITVNATDFKGRKAANITRVRAVWIEADRPDCPLLPAMPHIEVESSPGKHHRYFLCDDDGASLAEHGAVMRRLVDDYGSDPNAMDVARVLRLPGFFHCKDPLSPHRVDLLSTSAELPWPWERVKAVFPPKPKATNPAPVATQAPISGTAAMEVAAALQHIDPDQDYSTWLSVGMAIHGADSTDAGLAQWDAWSAQGALHKPGDCAYRWSGFHADGNTRGKITVGSLFRLARQSGWDGGIPASVLVAAIGDIAAQVKADVGWPFEQETVELFTRLMRSAPAQWQRVREELRAAKVSLRELDRMLKSEGLQQAAAARQISAANESPGDHPYSVENGCTIWERQTMIGIEPVRLANFAAKIVSEEIRDDGATERGLFVIDGENARGSLGAAAVPMDRFSSMGWVSGAFGNRAILAAGQQTRDHFRAAVQYLSGEVPRRVIYEHVGWRRIGEQWRYLSSAGAIGADGAIEGIETDLAGSMSRYQLCGDGQDIPRKTRQSLRLLESTANRELNYLLMAAAFRAPLGEAHRIDFSLWIAGRTGTRKTSLCAVLQGFWGNAFDDRTLPANWEDTATDLEIKCHAAKDAVLIIDDFKPKSGNVTETRLLCAKADRVLHSAGNQAGRGRRTADLKARPVYSNRALVVSTGEDIPPGASLRGRMVICEMKPADIDLSTLSELQQLASDGDLADVMSAYIRWLAPQLDGLKESLPGRVRAWRQKDYQMGHSRHLDTLGNLVEGLRSGLAFCHDVGAIDSKQHASLMAEGEQRLLNLMMNQAEYQSDTDELDEFLRMLRASVDLCRSHLCAIDDGGKPEDARAYGWRKGTEGDWQPCGERIGWTDGRHVWLHPAGAFSAAHGVARDQGSAIVIGQRTLWRRMLERGFIPVHDENRPTTPRTVGGRRPRVVIIDVKTLFPVEG